MAQRPLKTTLFDVVSAVSEATRDDTHTVRIVSELIRSQKLVDGRGIPLRLSLAPETKPRTLHRSHNRAPAAGDRRV